MNCPHSVGLRSLPEAKADHGRNEGNTGIAETLRPIRYRRAWVIQQLTRIEAIAFRAWAGKTVPSLFLIEALPGSGPDADFALFWPKDFSMIFDWSGVCRDDGLTLNMLRSNIYSEENRVSR
jgi:hypothetical protein